MFLTVVYEMQGGKSIQESPILNWILTDTIPEFSDLRLAKSSLHLSQESSSDVHVDNSLSGQEKAERQN
jgi:hypothetical protein